MEMATRILERLNCYGIQYFDENWELFIQAIDYELSWR